jgi:hypothetical protein
MPTRHPFPARTCAATAALLVVLLSGAAASAQANLTITYNEDYGDTDTDGKVILNIRECKENLQRSVDFQFAFGNEALVNTGQQYALYRDVTGTACDVSDSDSALPSDTEECDRVQESQNTTASESFNDLTLSEWLDIDNSDDCEVDPEYTPRLFVAFETVNVASFEEGYSATTFDFDLETERPSNAASDITVTGGQSSIKVSFASEDDDDLTYNVYYGTADFTSGAKPEDIEGTFHVRRDVSSGVTIESGIQVNQVYNVTVVTVNAAGNESLISEGLVVQASTQPTDDFYELYRDAGGQDGGFDCSVSGTPHRSHGAPLALGLGLLALLGLALRRARASRAHLGRSRGRLHAVAALLALTLLSTPAMAQDFDHDDTEDTTGLFGLRLGTYLPEVDQGLGLSNGGPYETAFADESMFLFELELDQVLYQDIGIFGLAFQVGLMDVEGRAINEDGTRSSDTTELNVAPLRMGVFYRFDLLAKEYNIPFVPVAGAGLDYFIWWINSGEGKLATAQGDTGFGGVLGWHASLGLQLHLDWFDPTSANGLLLDFGVSNSYLLVDYTITRVNGFGDDAAMDLSDENWMFGVMFEY